MTEALREQAVAYLLGELDSAAATEFERRLASDRKLRAEVDSLASVVHELRELPPEGWAAEDPPPLRLPITEPPRAAPPRRSPWGMRLTRGRLALAGVAALGAVAGAIVIGNEIGQDSEPVLASIDLRPLDGSQSGATGEVELAADRAQTADIVVDGLPASAPGTHYELWLLQGEETVSLGSFTVGADGHADATVSIPVDPASYDSFDISLEPDDVDPTHSGDSVLRGPTALS